MNEDTKSICTICAKETDCSSLQHMTKDGCDEMELSDAGSHGKGERGIVLKEAIEVINGERQDHYGNPEDSFDLIAKYWTTYLHSEGWIQIRHVPGREGLQKENTSMMMVLFKIAREANQHKRDNIVDAAGYLGIYGDMQ